jgi:pyruvate dehydrogenase E2 component (dihydrolipoamide acetyltransferase)
MVTDVVMPRYSLTMQKGTVVKWLKKEGEPVEKDEPLVEIEADKVTTELESPASGILIKICAPEESEVLIGEPIAFIGKLGEPLPNIGKANEERAVRKERAEVFLPTGMPKREEEAEKIRASPLARSLAEQYRIDLTQIRGTGPGCRITREDVLRLIELRKDTRAVKIVPFKGMQKTIAERMSRSIKTAAHCSIMIEVDASRMTELRERVTTELKSNGKDGVSFTDILVKAVLVALRVNPILNSTLENDQLKVFEDVNIGIAVEVEAEGNLGLLVPVVHQANRKSLTEISEESRSLIKRARAGKASYDDLSGGTFTITNLGMYGVETFVPIINPPETAILGVGAIIEKPLIIEGKVEARPSMRLTLSFDHRVVNGAPAARFMQRLKQILEEEISENQ